MATPNYFECNLYGSQQPYEPFVPAVCKQCDSLPLSNLSALDLYPAHGTPLWLSQRFAPGLRLDSVYIKEERYGPTSSFKDRQPAGVITAVLENVIKEVNEGQKHGGGK